MSLGAITTYLLSNKFHLSTTISSSLVGFLGVIIFEKINKEKYKLVPASLYCGSFIGMSAMVVVHNPLVILIAGILGGLIFVKSQNYFIGIGGKLGTMAFISVVITVFFFRFLKLI